MRRVTDGVVAETPLLHREGHLGAIAGVPAATAPPSDHSRRDARCDEVHHRRCATWRRVASARRGASIGSRHSDPRRRNVDMAARRQPGPGTTTSGDIGACEARSACGCFASAGTSPSAARGMKKTQRDHRRESPLRRRPQQLQANAYHRARLAHRRASRRATLAHSLVAPFAGAPFCHRHPPGRPAILGEQCGRGRASRIVEKYCRLACQRKKVGATFEELEISILPARKSASARSASEMSSTLVATPTTLSSSRAIARHRLPRGDPGACADQLGQHRIVVEGDFTAALDATLPPYAWASGRPHPANRPGARQEAVGGVFAGDPAFDRPATGHQSRARNRHRPSGSNSQLLANEVHAVHLLGDRVLDLNARARSRGNRSRRSRRRNLAGAGAAVSHRNPCGHCGRAHPFAQCIVDRDRGSLLQQLLVSPLDGAFAFADMQRKAFVVRQDLDLRRDGGARCISRDRRCHRRRPWSLRSTRPPARRRAGPGRSRRACPSRRRRQPP